MSWNVLRRDAKKVWQRPAAWREVVKEVLRIYFVRASCEDDAEGDDAARREGTWFEKRKELAEVL